MEERVFDFSKAADRRGTGCAKWDDAPRLYGSPDVLPLWVADMDFPAPPEVRSALGALVEHGVFGYPSGNQERATASLVGWLSRRFGWDVPPDEVVLAPGVVPSLKAAVEILTEPGDGILVQPPVYHPFFDLGRALGRRIVENPLAFRDGNWLFDLEDLEAKASQAKVLVLCNPHNPVGRVWTRQELGEVSAICSRHGVLVLSDEIHADLVYSPRKHTPFALAGGAAANDALTFVAPSKTFNIAGLNTSAVVMPNGAHREAFVAAFRRRSVPRVNTPGLVAMEAAYDHGEAWLGALLSHLDANARRIESFVQERLAPLRNTRPEGTYLSWIDCRELGLDESELSRFFAETAKVGLNRGGMFGTPGRGWMRLNFGTSLEILDQALGRIEIALSTLRK